MRTVVSKNPIGLILRAEQDPCIKYPIKPKGLWYSVNGGWEEWCAAEQPNWLHDFRYELTLGDEKILKLDSKEAVVEVALEYPNREFLAILSLGKCASGYIDWRKLAEDYDGIEVNPYFHDLRFHPSLIWYYAWDCTSGCIWRTKGATLKQTVVALVGPQA